MDAKTIRVHAPSPVLFVCGGPYDITSDLPRSLRDAFLKGTNSGSLSRYTILIAEELNEAFYPRASYSDILKLEADMAQISASIILFLESYGSAAELGAFAMVKEVSQRLLVVTDDYYYNKNSFISLGPLRYLQREHGEPAVYVLNRKDIGISSLNDVSKIDINLFCRELNSAITNRVKTLKDHSSFDSTRPGHVIRLIVGLIQHYGALTLDEIDTFLYVLNAPHPPKRIEELLLCAIFAEWLSSEKRGLHTYFTARAENAAMSYRFKAGFATLDKLRWKADIMEYWKENDSNRFNCIIAARRSG